MKYLKLYFLFLCPVVLCAQVPFRAYEDSLLVLQNTLYAAQNDEAKLDVNSKLKAVFERALKLENSFNYPFDSLKEIGRIYAPDKSFRIINWDILRDDGTHDYFGFVQVIDKKKKVHRLFFLTDKSNEIKNPANAAGDANKWFGMLYYKIIPVKVKRKKFYTLLGLDANDKLTTKKIIDVLYFTSDGSPHFGANLFKLDKGYPKRMIFEYSAQVVMSLKYDEGNKQIIFDHLSPLQPKFEGQFQYYGPDFSFDAIEFKKGKWTYVPDVDARNNKTSKDANYNDPKEKNKNYDNRQFYSPMK